VVVPAAEATAAAEATVVAEATVATKRTSGLGASRRGRFPRPLRLS
jgi:hypothetical protein